MSDGESFVDARLYITIRPTLEYRIIEVGQNVMSQMVGDDDGKSMEFTNVTGNGVQAESVSSFTSITDLDSLCSLSMSVCSMTEEYLRSMEMEWIEFLTRIHSGIRNELRVVRKKIEHVQRLRERYRGIRNVEVDEEISNEMYRLHDQVEAILDRYRGAEIPQVRRSEELRVATTRLRCEFGGMYGVVPTKTLARVKCTFEGEMASIQEVISRSFDRRLKEVLHRPV